MTKCSDAKRGPVGEWLRFSSSIALASFVLGALLYTVVLANPHFEQDITDTCHCGLGVFFPTRIASGGGTCWSLSGDPGANAYTGVDILWFKTICQPAEGATSPHDWTTAPIVEGELSDTAWGPWLECPCVVHVLAQWMGADGVPRQEEDSKLCYMDWHRV
jgi:hypothetical protein